MAAIKKRGNKEGRKEGEIIGKNVKKLESLYKAVVL